MQSATALLDQLMGASRNASLDERAREAERDAKRHFSDPDVCKLFLCGIDPYALFAGTRNELPPRRGPPMRRPPHCKAVPGKVLFQSDAGRQLAGCRAGDLCMSIRRQSA